MSKTVPTRERGRVLRDIDEVAAEGDAAQERDCIVMPFEEYEDICRFCAGETIAGDSNDETIEVAVLLKRAIHAGSLQERSGWSNCNRVRNLLPGDDEDDHYGMTGALIGSLQLQRWTVHCNVAAARNRAGHAEWFGGVILEGAAERAVRRSQRSRSNTNQEATSIPIRHSSARSGAASVTCRSRMPLMLALACSSRS